MAEIHYTKRYEDDLVQIYKNRARKWDHSVAGQKLQQVAQVEAIVTILSFKVWIANLVPIVSCLVIFRAAFLFL